LKSNFIISQLVCSYQLIYQLFIDHLLNEIKDRLTDLKLQLAGMKERLSVEFRVDLDEIIDEPRTGEVPLEELKEKNERMKKRLENMGEINPQ
jgi:chromosome segregation protein